MSVTSIWTALRGYGLTEQGTAALMGNLKAESGLSSINVQDNCPENDAVYTAAVDSGSKTKYTFAHDSYGYGLAQWTYYSRKEGLYDYAKSKGKSIGDETTQIEYLMKELTSSYPSLLSFLKTTSDTSYATTRVCTEFERPAYNNVATRYTFAKAIYEECTGKAVASTTSSETATYTAKVSVDMPILSQGDKGLAVGMAQFCLIKKGYNLGSYGNYKDGIDCDFGAMMLAAVNDFKSKKGINTSYGKVDKLTWEALYE